MSPDKARPADAKEADQAEDRTKTAVNPDRTLANEYTKYREAEREEERRLERYERTKSTDTVRPTDKDDR